MSSNTLEIGAFGAASGVIFYQMVEGDIFNALLVPAIGYSLSKIGEHYKYNKISEVGTAVLFASAISGFGSLAGYVLSAAGERSIFSKTVGYIYSATCSYLFYDAKMENLSQRIAASQQ